MKKSTASNNSKQSKKDADVCVVCFKSSQIYSVGECDHPVCYECSTRMRVLINRNECPICRKDLSQVVFLSKPNLVEFQKIVTRNMSFEARYAIYFESDKVMQAYDNLLEHVCPQCDRKVYFNNFSSLKEHVQRTHQLFYCDLCVDHLKIFSKERRAYNRSELAQHRRKGDSDNTSHRGHPLCKFCDTRFLDEDELFRHLRKDHYYCHFCDADGLHQYYPDYPALRAHFSSEHFLCTEGDCKDEQFTSVFRNKLDRQAHYLEAHAEGKHAIRQARTLDIEFSLSNGASLVERGGASGRGRGRGGRGGRSNRDERWEEPEFEPAPVQMTPQQQIDINCVQNFPVLGAEGGPAGVSVSSKPAQTTITTTTSSSTGGGGGKSFTLQAMRGNIASRQEEFPALGNSVATHVHLRVNTNKDRGGGAGAVKKGSVSVQYNRTAAANNGPMTSSGKSSNGAASKSQQSSSFSIRGKPGASNYGHGNKENNTEEYPSLGMPSKSLGDMFGTINITPLVNNSQLSYKPKNNFTFQTKSKDNNKNNNTSNKPFSQSDFPSLLDENKNKGAKNYQGVSKVSVPVSNNWTKASQPPPPPQAETTPRTVTPTANEPSKSSTKKKKSKTENVSQNGKKRPTRITSTFDCSDEDEQASYFSMTKEGDYTSVAAPTSSNVKILSAQEHQQRKKSELNIGTLKSVPKLTSKDFPSLGLGAGNNSGSAVDSSWGNKKKSNNQVKNVTNTDMTFHNSYGESFIVPSSNKTSSDSNSASKKSDIEKYKSNQFIHPNNFEERNRNLIQIITNECGKDSSNKFNKFKKLAKSMQGGNIDGEEYYRECRELMGSEVMLRIFPELLLLLPSIVKQQSVLTGFIKMEGQPKADKLGFVTCSRCGQVVGGNEQEHHQAQHTEKDFPSLRPKSAGRQFNGNS